MRVTVKNEPNLYFLYHYLNDFFNIGGRKDAFWRFREQNPNLKF